jgi:plasmid stabilization system protein ParE
MKVGFHPAADVEFRAAAAYYERRAPGLGMELSEELKRQCALVGEHPSVGARYDSAHRRVFLRRFPFALIYRADDSGVTIVAVAHVRKRPGYWRGRT